ncbi:retrovirus-related pol polyprotein from transposon TNT 1-94 [Tanacetum coccineum]
MKESSTLKDYLDALNSILIDWKNVKVKIDDEDVASTKLLGSDQFTLSLSQANRQRAIERAPSSLIPKNIFRAVITKRLASLTGKLLQKTSISNRKASKDLPFGLVASFLDKSESRIRIKLGLSAIGAMGATSLDWVDIEHTKAKEKFKPRESNAQDTCNYCKEEGHWKFNYPKLEEKKVEEEVSERWSMVLKHVELVVPRYMDHDFTSLVVDIDDQPNSPHLEHEQDVYKP